MVAMRSAIALILAILVSAFLAGIFALLSPSEGKRKFDEAAVTALVKKFASTDSGTGTFRMSELGNREELLPVSNPRSVLPQISDIPYFELAALYRFAESCEGKPPGLRVTSRVAKAYLWHEHVCRPTTPLPANFFEKPPYFHPSGSSYVRLAYLTHGAEFVTQEWIRNHLKYSHILERADFPSELLNASEKIASLLSRSALRALNEESEMVLVLPSIILLKKNGRESGTTYSVHSLPPFQKFLLDSRLIVETTDEGSRCSFRVGNACWNLDSERIARDARRPTLLLSAFTLVLALFAAVLLFRNLNRTRTENLRRQFALSVLTHELRTPVASLVLHVDQIRKDFDTFTESTQNSLLAALDDSQRLLRLTHATNQYLPAITGKRVSLKPQNIPSIRETVSDLIAELGSPVAFLPGPDFNLQADPYWFSVAIRNLLRNSVVHGRPPITVRTIEISKTVQIRIEDAGTCEFKSLREMTTPLRKSDRSSGTGLGLAIVDQIAREMGGTLLFQTNPTRFTFEIPRGGTLS